MREQEVPQRGVIGKGVRASHHETGSDEHQMEVESIWFQQHVETSDRCNTGREDV
jgi:hypothetical protein